MVTFDLESLSVKQMRDLRATLDHRLTQTREPPTVFEQELWDAIMTAFGQKPGKEATMSVEQFMKRYGRKRFGDCAVKVEDFINSAVGVNPLNRVVRMEILRRCIKCLMKEDGVWDGKMPTPPALVDNLYLLPMAVDQNYPGYAASKLLHRIAPVALQNAA